ncbi:MAG: N-6 DNA methylase [Planctomycetota bacterium]|nr:MAG: N-6 DNA methylase [Planctomycetota bacterium]
MPRRARYDKDYSARRLRALASSTRGTGAAGLWQSLGQVTTSLSRAGGCPALGLPGLGSFLWTGRSTPDLPGPDPDHSGPSVLIRDRDLLDAVRALCALEQYGDAADRAVDVGTRRGVNFGDVEVGQLGSVYESLLGLRPELDVSSGTFALGTASGSERKASGSYYTPDALVQHVLDSALDPVIERRLGLASASAKTTGESLNVAREEAILGITVCDPACGSGHFLVAAAHRLAHRLARIRAGVRQPATEDHRRAFRDVVSRCLYGVDLNPMAAELCRLSLWLESHDPGRSMPCLDARIRVGNALLGATPELICRGIPDEAFQMRSGDDPRVVRLYKTRNTQERRTREGDRPARNSGYRPTGASDRLMSGGNARLVADAWCAAFVWRKHDTDRSEALADCPGAWNAITGDVLHALNDDPDSVQPWIRDEIERLAAAHRFFHWHLEFPEVCGSSPGAAAAEPDPRARQRRRPPTRPGLRRRPREPAVSQSARDRERHGVGIGGDHAAAHRGREPRLRGSLGDVPRPCRAARSAGREGRVGSAPIPADGQRRCCRASRGAADGSPLLALGVQRARVSRRERVHLRPDDSRRRPQAWAARPIGDGTVCTAAFDHDRQ